MEHTEHKESISFSLEGEGGRRPDEGGAPFSRKTDTISDSPFPPSHCPLPHRERVFTRIHPTKNFVYFVAHPIPWPNGLPGIFDLNSLL